MTRFIERPQAELARENRTPVRRPDQMSIPLFQGWGPKF